MGVFDRTICDCCVCPMQCVMQQLVVNQPDVTISTPVSQVVATINSVENFIADTSVGFFAVCNVTSVSSDVLGGSTTLKPLKKDVKGECKCCEDPATNELVSLGMGALVEIEFVTQVPGDEFDIPLIGNIANIGEGIVILENVTDGNGFTLNTAISTCQITRIDTAQA
ncbi:hypothetical protein [Chengkuizengella axinellae]|uniref:Uncharacterized protein n=1 Tax=Chengkuizengella axinellae TaxID=3064388 RepID=A0ABT9J0F8_9BACL|nr:hypothetical protein [Chengkuizengella sp. 2205SS18-9]MDP5275058.1 hypothetical protein [Chengkuizengella sp. 2205SS18-9]